MEVRKDSREMSVVKGGGEKKSRREMSEGMKRKRGERVTRRTQMSERVWNDDAKPTLHRLVRQTYRQGTAVEQRYGPRSITVCNNSLAQNKSEGGFLKAQ
jgi:hypothetical protein